MCLTRLHFIFIILVFGCTPYLAKAQFNSQVEAKIDIQTETVLTKISFSAYNKTTIKKSLRYKVLIVKKSNNNSSQEQFEDEQFFVIEPGERKNISTTSIAIEEAQRTIIFILIYENDKVIGKDRVVINGFEGEDDMKPRVVHENELAPKIASDQPQDVNLLTGLVFESTKTKPGRDFYQMFYLAYTANNINGSKIVKVDEVLAIGGNTQMKIFAGDDLVVQFFLNPRTSYIKEMVDQSILRVNQYFLQNKAIQQNTIQY